MERSKITQLGSLRAALDYEPQELQFGTSGRRGEVIHLTQLEVYINVLGELEYLQTQPRAEGGVTPGEAFYYASDLRPSSTRFVPEQGGRGEIAQAVERALRDAGMQPVNMGRIPTPALMHYAVGQGKGSLMVTGSHIPFDRNGYKVNTSRGELLKRDEEPVNARVRQVRERVYAQPFAESPFDSRGMFKAGSQELLPESDAARAAYLRRYTDFFAGESLRGMRLVVYQHSAVGRDLLAELLRALDAEVIPAGRSETFVPIDTENIDDAQLAALQALADEAAARYGPIDAVVSTDGDSDRPLLLGVDAPTGRVRFFGGDLLGMVTAEYLGADAVVVPISCNDAVDRGRLAGIVEPKTKIGSPHVIAGMERALQKGRRAVCGWEANGGFLTGSDIARGGRVLTALQTRDAMLPLLCALLDARAQGLSLTARFARLPQRFSRAALLPRFPRAFSLAIVQSLSPADPRAEWACFESDGLLLRDARGNSLQATPKETVRMQAVRERLEAVFAPSAGFGPIDRINYTDGVRIYFEGGEVAHVRPSGNADELRIYAVADTQERADAIARMGVTGPDSLLRRLEREEMQRRETEALRAFAASPDLLPLTGAVQHYDWGGLDFIPQLLGVENPARQPFAELWIGAHPGAPSTVTVEETPVPLDRLAEAAPEALLGPAAARFDSRLPYLLKVLDARRMLSIQAHPTKRQAEEGFARENAAGIGLKDPARSYKDDNHKPEVHVALTEFWMLHGFRPLEEIAQTLRAVPEFTPLMPDFAERLAQAGGDENARRELLRALYNRVMTLPQEQADALLDPLIARLQREGATDKDTPAYWALRAAGEFPLPGGHRDRGLFSIYLLNLLHLRPGEGTYQPAGALHAYLEGVNVELMANSDNVLRGGLTTKHVDVRELMRTLTFESGTPEILRGEVVSGSEKVYRTPAEEFELSRIELAPGQAFAGRAAHGPEALILLEGSAHAASVGRTLELKRGQIVLAPGDADYTLTAGEERAVLYRAAIPG